MTATILSHCHEVSQFVGDILNFSGSVLNNNPAFKVIALIVPPDAEMFSRPAKLLASPLVCHFHLPKKGK